jgi:hypothetical protein
MQVFARIESLEGCDRRSAVRHKLHLDVTLAGTGDKVVIHNLSPTGILIETATQLATSDQFEVDLPEVGATVATVIWNSDTFFGCQFRNAIPPSAVSAALLRNPFAPAMPSPVSDERYEVGVHDADFEDDRYPFGVRLRVILGLSAALWALILWSIGLI